MRVLPLRPGVPICALRPARMQFEECRESEAFRCYLNQQERGVVVFVAEAARRLRSAAARAPRGLTSTTRAASRQPTPSSARMPSERYPQSLRRCRRFFRRVMLPDSAVCEFTLMEQRRESARVSSHRHVSVSPRCPVVGARTSEIGLWPPSQEQHRSPESALVRRVSTCRPWDRTNSAKTSAVEGPSAVVRISSFRMSGWQSGYYFTQA